MTDQEFLYWFDLESDHRRSVVSDSAFVRSYPEVMDCVENALEQRRSFRKSLAPTLSAITLRAKASRKKLAGIAELMLWREDRTIKGLEELTKLRPTPEGEELDIEKAKQFPILDLFPPSRRAGRSHVVRCPFHGEKTASCHLYPDTNSFYCFGCNENGDVIDAYMKLNNLDFRSAVVQLSR